MENLKNLFKSLALPVLATAVIFGLTLYVFLPKLKEYQKMRKDIKVQEEKIIALGKKLNELNSLSEKELQDNLELSLSALPEEKDFYPVVSSIKNVFNEEGILLPQFTFNVGEVSTPSAQASQKAKAKIDNFFLIKLSFLGPFEKAEKVISRLEKSLPLLSIDSIDLVTEKSASFSGQMTDYTGSMTLKSYFAPLPKVLGAVESPLPKIESAQKKQLEMLLGYELYRAPVEEVSTENMFVGRENPFPVY